MATAKEGITSLPRKSFNEKYGDQWKQEDMEIGDQKKYGKYKKYGKARG